MLIVPLPPTSEPSQHDRLLLRKFNTAFVRLVYFHKCDTIAWQSDPNVAVGEGQLNKSDFSDFVSPGCRPTQAHMS